MTIEPLTRQHYIDFNGEPPQISVKGLSLVDGDKVFCIAGIVHVMGEYFVFFGAKPGFSKRDIIRGWRRFKTMLDEHKTYYAIIDREFKTSAGMLEHFGFTHLYDDLYVYEGG